jgi:hypothetical protein
MHLRLAPRAALLALAVLPFLAAPARSDEAGKPTLVIRAASIDDLVADVRFLATAAGREDEARNFEAIIKSKIDGKGIEGLDTTRPLGLYATVGPAGHDSTGVVLVPIADEKATLKLIENLLNKQPSKDGDLYKLEIDPVPMPIYFRFANKYLYATIRDKEVLDKDKLRDPAEVLQTDKPGTLWANVHIDRIPAEVRNLVLNHVNLNLANVKEKAGPNESPAVAGLRGAVIDDLYARIKSLVHDGGPIELRLDIDRKAKEVSVSASLAGQSGSALARNIAELAQVRSVAATLVGADSAMSLQANAALPAKIRTALGPVIDEVEKKLLEQIPDPGAKELIAALLEAATPTLKGARLDAGFDIRGPGAGGKYTLLAGLHVKDGAGIDKALRKVADKLPAPHRDQIKFDFDKVGMASIHQVKAELEGEGRELRDILGDNPFYLAIRDDAVLVSAGEKGLAALKEALGTAPKAGRIIALELSVAHLAPLMEKKDKGAVDLAKKVFTKPGSDKVRISVSGGDALKFRLSARAELVEFFTRLEEARKAGQ